MRRWLSILLLWGTLLSLNLLRKEVVAQDRFPTAEWKHSGSLWLLTTAEGAALPAGSQVEQFPLLIRLHRDYFDFAQAQTLGEDLRFTTSDGILMPSQVDAWDVQNGQASIWVLVPKIVGDARQEIKLYWGNPMAKASPRAKEVFQASNGYLSVWHMNQVSRTKWELFLPSTRGRPQLLESLEQRGTSVIAKGFSVVTRSQAIRSVRIPTAPSCGFARSVPMPRSSAGETSKPRESCHAVSKSASSAHGLLLFGWERRRYH